MARHASIFKRRAVFDPNFDPPQLELEGTTEVEAGTLPPLTVQVGVVQRDSDGVEVLATGYGGHARAAVMPAPAAAADPFDLSPASLAGALFAAVPGVLGTRLTQHAIIDGRPDTSWEVRVEGPFRKGPATAFGMQIEFDAELGAFETLSWTQLIEIEIGTLEVDPLT